jgi:hypothetical protein
VTSSGVVSVLLLVQGEAAGPAVRAVSACSDRTHRGSMQANDGVTEQDFRKRDEQKAGSASM